MRSAHGRGETPIYRQIATELWGRIQNGELRPGERMSTELELSAEFAVNRLTVRQALAELQQLGAIEVRRGTGTFVAQPPDLVEIVASVPRRVRETETTQTALGEHLDDGVIDVPAPRSTAPVRRVAERIDFVGPATGASGEIAAAHLSTPIDELLHLDTVMVQQDRAWIVNSYWLPTKFAGVVDALDEHGLVVGTLRDGLGLDLAYQWRAFSAAAAGYDEARLLGISIGGVLLVRDGVTADTAGDPVFYVRRRMRGESAKFVLRYGS